MQKFDLVVSGNIVTPAGIVGEGWIGIEGEKITAAGQGAPPDAIQVHEYPGKWIISGVIDGQTHAGSYGGLKGLESTTRSAVAGGVTTIVDMPYDNPNPLNSIERLKAKIEAVESLGHCDVALYATVTRDKGTTEVRALIAAGVCAFKISSFESHPDRFPRIPTDQTFALLEALAPTDLPLGLHNENQEIVRAATKKMRAQRRNDISAHADARPEAAELAATAEFLELGAVTGGHVHLVHLSSARGYELVERYRNAGTRATAELCVHYLTFDPKTDGTELGAKMKVNPPIRPGARDGLYSALTKKQIKFVSSDHSSWPLDSKLTDSIHDAGAGIPGLETLLPSFYSELTQHNEDAIVATAHYLSEAPAKFFGLWPQKGSLHIGAYADIAILEQGSFVHDSAVAHDDLNWSPYDGHRFDVRVVGTFVRGRHAWDGDRILSKPGMGHYVRRPLCGTQMCQNPS